MFALKDSIAIRVINNKKNKILNVYQSKSAAKKL